MSDFRVFVLICVVLGGMGQGIVAPKLPVLLEGATRLAFESGVSASLMYFGIFISTFRFGKLADAGKVHRLLPAGLVSYAITLVLLGSFRSLWANFALRLCEGLSLSAVFVAADFVLGRLSKNDERGEWLSYYGVAMSIGLLLGPAIALSLGHWSPSPLFPLSVAALVAVALGFGALFFRVDAVSTESDARPALNRIALLMGASYGFMEAGLVAVLPVMATVVFKVAPEGCLMVVIVSAAISSLLWGKASDHFGPRRVLVILAVFFALGPAAISVASQNSAATAWIYLSCALFGILAGGLYPIGFSWLLQSVSDAHYGYASGAFARAYGLGSLAGPLAVGIASERFHMNGLLLTLSMMGFLSWISLKWGAPSEAGVTEAASVPSGNFRN